MIVVVNYGMGNVGSLINMLKHIGVEAKASADVDDLKRASKLIIPGVGAFDSGMSALNRLGLIPLLTQRVEQEKTPVLGICLGMQLLTRGSEEGQARGLGWIAAKTVRFAPGDAADGFKIPHMGWNTIVPLRETPLIDSNRGPLRFYFVHSYYVVCDRQEDVLAETFYGTPFASAISHENIMGVQFHPEKSHAYGKSLLSNFAVKL